MIDDFDVTKISAEECGNKEGEGRGPHNASMAIYLLSNYGGGKEKTQRKCQKGSFEKPTARYYYLNVLLP